MCSSFSNFSWIILSGSPSNCLKKSSKSFKNIPMVWDRIRLGNSKNTQPVKNITLRLFM